ncbi:MAG: hypothetical protein A2Y62_07155 [Candidatus Fischerbacteria bacterium RBG_13_37_8]|uniref:DUF6788 domain-containing protein n=1 Tax=Candidatus Fischerbacteria bacterium RBG_13_37_8 TaxID=1817863 RepID=A0A1F5VV77_9BACT|nr:MAG: hypothetical protein A2Y62_07155 [Candidatus Fischerbacteria bacterium RBG_13_37_8]
MRSIGQMIKGSIVIRTITCGKANCKCTKGALHRAICITYKEKGKTKTIYIAKEHEAEALLMCANYKRMKELLQKLTSVNIDIVRTPRRYNVKRKKH